MEQFTKAEEKVMQVLWKLGKGFVKDLVEAMPNPKPPYNTVLSVVRLLEKKGMVGHTAYGKTHEYHPLVSLSEHRKNTLEKLASDYFGGSYKQIVSFLAQEEKLSPEEIDEIRKMIDKLP